MSSASTKRQLRRGTWIALAALAGTQVALAQPLRCTAIRPGETATQVARRITGEARSTRASWFQIVDPATSRYVPKASYDYVRAGWSACVADAPIGTAAPRRAVPPTYDEIASWALLLGVIALASHGADHYLKNRKKVVDAMQQFGERFVQEFEGPLVRPGSSTRPIQSRLRVMPDSQRLEILIAPGAGHRYPNLTDHRNNVEYDLNRVLHVLRDQPFTNESPYMHGTWVVLPFQLKPGITQVGAT